MDIQTVSANSNEECSGNALDRHRIDGEYIYNGVVYGGTFPQDVLESIPDYNYMEGDVILASYPKSGR